MGRRGLLCGPVGTALWAGGECCVGRPGLLCGPAGTAVWAGGDCLVGRWGLLCGPVGTAVGRWGLLALAVCPLQVLAIPMILRRRNVLVGAETGSGKTLSYLTPLLSLIKEEEETGGVVARLRRPRALIVAPSRVLAQQILVSAHTHTKVRHCRLTVSLLACAAVSHQTDVPCCQVPSNWDDRWM